MGTFVTQETEPDLYLTKTPAPGAVIPPGLTAANVVQAADMNALEAALLDCRAALRGQAFDVRNYGALGDDAADDGPALQAAIAAAIAAGGGQVLVPKGTYRFSTTLALASGVGIVGVNSRFCTLRYMGTSTAIASASPSVRTFQMALKDVTVVTSTGAIGFDMDSVSTSTLESVAFSGFSSAGVHIHSGISGGAVYNRFYNVTAATCGTGYRISSASSNANVFVSCRANVCPTRGWDIQDSNDNTLVGCQSEGGGVGYYFNAAVAGTSDVNRLIACRAEGNTTGVQIDSANVRDVVIVFPWMSNTTNYLDSGSRTQSLDARSGFVRFVSQVSDRPFQFERVTNGGAELPAFMLVDSSTTTGTPVTLQIETERAPGFFLRALRAGTKHLEFDTTGQGYLSGRMSVGTTGVTDPFSSTSRFQASSTSATGIHSFTAYTNDGTQNRRARFFLDSTAGEFGLEGTAGSGAPTYVVRVVSARVMESTTTALRLGASGMSVGFMGATPVARPTISGSRGGNAALASLLTALASLGLITDSTTA